MPSRRSSLSGVPTPALRNLIVLAMLGLFVAILFLAPIFLPGLLATQGNDAESVAGMADVATTAEAFDGYAAVSLIYAYTNGPIRIALMLGFGSAMIALFLWWLRAPRMLMLACFMLLAPLILYLSFFTKDTFTTPLMVAATLVLATRAHPVVRMGAVAAMYLAYAFVFRQYYIIIVVAWFGVLLMLNVSWGWRLVLLVCLPLVMLAVPGNLWDTLQMQRDMVNYTRVGMAGEGNRTAFINLVHPDGLRTFAINYIYAAWRLNVPILLPGAGPKELFLFVNLCIYALFTVLGLRSGNPRVSWTSGLFLAHVLVLIIFEPDLGSYLRHLSTAIILLAPSLAMQDRLLHVRLLPAPRPVSPAEPAQTAAA